MQWTRRLALGALGGLIPYLVDLYYVRYEKMLFILQHLEYLAVPAAIAAGVPFVLAGALWALADRTESRPLRLVESGMVVCAVFLALTNTVELGDVREKLYQTTDPRAVTTTMSSPFALPAFQGSARSFPVPSRETVQTRFLQAIAGIERELRWYVVVGGLRRMPQAVDEAQAVDGESKEFKAEVYRPYGENPFFKVVIGAELPFGKAVRLRDKAVEAGIQFEPWIIQHKK